MDPVTLIVAALAAGASAEMTDTVPQSISDTYTVNITASGDRSVAAHTIHGGVRTGDTRPANPEAAAGDIDRGGGTGWQGGGPV